MERTVVVQLLDHLGEALCRLLVKVGDGDTRGEHSVVGVLCGEVCGGLGGEVLQKADASVLFKDE